MARQTLVDLEPFPGRFGQAWRVALLCALVAGVAMVYKVPEIAIGCYLVIFLARPNGAEVVGQSIGLIILASIVVFAMAPLINVTASYPLMRMAVIALISFGFVFLGAASTLGEIGSIIALVVVFILTLVDRLPIGEVATRGLLYAWQMSVMPMTLMIVFYLIFGTSPHRLLRETAAGRLDAAADALDAPGSTAARHLDERLADGNDESFQQVLLARVFHTAPAAAVTWLSGAVTSTYRLLLAVAALPGETSAASRAALAAACRAAARSVTAGRRPEPPATVSVGGGAALDTAWKILAALAQPNGGSDVVAPRPPFLAADAFTNPDYQRYGLKTTGAAISCYLIYSLIGWQGIHTAMITCYVAALGTTGETVHKLALRITGCLIGAAMGFGAILFVIPHLDSVGGLMALVFVAILVAAWVSTGNERISYGGVQIGLAFLLTVLNGFAPSLDMDSGRDRIVGILLGNLMVYVFFTSFWPKSAAVDVRARMTGALAVLARLATLPSGPRSEAVSEAAQVESEAAKARAQLLLLPFEPASQRPSPERIVQLKALVAETRAVLPALMFAEKVPAEVSAGFGAAAAQMAHTAKTAGRSSEERAVEDVAGLAGRVRRIERLAAGVSP